MSKTKSYTAIGIMLNGEKVKKSGSMISFSNLNLKEIYIYDGVTCFGCCNNPELKIFKYPDSLRYLACDKDLIDYDKCEIESVSIKYEY